MAITKLSTNGIYGDKYADFAANNNNWYEAIQTVLLTSTTGEVNFTNIPQDYTHLQIRYRARSTRAATDTQINMRFNEITTSSYSAHIVYGDGSSAASAAYANNTFINMNDIPAANATSNTFNATIVDILDYKDTSKFKTVRSLIGRDINGSGLVMLHSGVFLSTNAITAIKFYPAADSFAANSRFSLYGLRG